MGHWYFFTHPVTLYYSVQQAATQKSFQKNSINDFPKVAGFAGQKRCASMKSICSIKAR